VRPIAVANTVGALLGAALFSGFFLLTLYMQQVLGYSALEAGFAFLATAGTVVVAAGFSQALVTRIGVKPVMTTGLVLLTLAYLWYTRMPPDGSYWVDLFPAYFASGIGLAFVFIPLSLAALSGVDEKIAGIASGLLNTSQQIGGALGVAIISTISTTHAEDLLADGVPQGEALTEGFQWAFWVIASFAATGAAISALVLRSRDVPKAAEAPGSAM
jgi:Na+/melibiose symporter-like transporter